MSGLLAGKVWQSNLDGTLKPLAACLADIANDDGTRIYPSLEYICWLMGKSERAIQYQLRSLVDKGILVEVSKPTRPGEYIEYRMEEDNLPKRKKWSEVRRQNGGRVLKRGAKIAPIVDEKGVQKTTEMGAIISEMGAKNDIRPYYDPSLDPSLTRGGGNFPKQELPRRRVDPEKDTLQAARDDLMSFLKSKIGDLSKPGVETKALNWLLERYNPDEIEKCWGYVDSQTWRGSAITWKTVKDEIGAWKAKGSPARYTNGAANSKTANDEYRGPGRSKETKEQETARISCEKCFGTGTDNRDGRAKICRHPGYNA